MSNEAGSILAVNQDTRIADHLKVLRESLSMHVPYTGGVHPVKPEDLVVYYATDDKDNARAINLSNATEARLLEMAAACEPAPFGANQVNVLDESYRKAGKMDLSKFAARFDVVASGLLDAISPDILDGQNAANEQVLRAEMYKLNVYGPGSFFKAHKDTPRSEDMIGSLVVVFPTAHKGGELTLSHGQTTWTFDSAAEIAAHAPPSAAAVAYVAFFSDVTHAVEPVLEGHRVTLTYNLFLANRPTHANGSAVGHRIPPAPEHTFQDTLHALLADSTFLPAGGLLAFGLAHQYPMPTPPKLIWANGKHTLDMSASSFAPVLQMLKGSDARIRTSSERAGLTTHVKMLYNSGENDCGGGHDVLADYVLDTENVNDEHISLEEEIEKHGVILQRGKERMSYLSKKGLRKEGYTRRYMTTDEPEKERDAPVAVHWVTMITEANRVGSHYVRYGNEASLGHVYGNAALFVSVPAVGEGVRAAGVSA
ncbi:hypothetical protein B0H15DRAFT_905261 [Mycena belliarum]|uniref:Prolyl 4-hydroxylase alpha subunit Fe(2+) 2OG dioxygenase domain-containing protein n=1 Tax=Mycena belliarum TaxID=1033014 RepID=A0AAD6XUD9_9AGAR|nr:hypothetical protein B0H15DRAFT_905261 [Mycena belliae]